MLSALARTFALFAALSGIAAGLVGAVTPAQAASEFMVNTYKQWGQSSPAIGRFANGSFVVVWRDDGVRTPDPTDREGRVRGQLYAANGAPAGAEFTVSGKEFSYSYVILGLPSVAVLADDTFVVVWVSDAGDISGWGNIHGQRLSAAGERIGKEFKINRKRPDSLMYRSVAALADGGFVVCWAAGDGQALSANEIYCQRFATDGQKLGDEFRAHRGNGIVDIKPAVAGLPNAGGTSRAAAPGGFVVVWQSDHQNGTRAIYGQMFAADGTKVGRLFTVAKSDTDLVNPRVAVLDDGSFVVVWEHSIDFVYNVRGQRFSADGVKTGGGFWLRRTRDNQANPDVAALSGGGFIIVYCDSLVPNGRIIGQRYAADGAAVGELFRVNSSRFDSYRLNPAVAGLKNGKFVVAWTGQEQGDPLWEDFEVIGRVFKE